MHKSVRSPIVWVGLVVGGVALAALVAFLFGLLVMALWNWLMPELFGLKALSYWQAWGLVLLAHILFKAGGHGPARGRERERDESWKQRFRDRFRKRCETEQAGSTPEAGQPV